MITEFDQEPIPGLPAKLPTGESILWQGSPHWLSLARQALHVEVLGIYFAMLLAWRLASGLRAHEPAADIVRSEAWLALLAGLAIAIVLGIARAMSRTTIYTITNARVLVRAGVALPVIVNLPFARIQSADLKQHTDGAGDIALKPTDAGGPGYAMLWPNARAWRLSTPEPTMRSIRDWQRAAGLLDDLLAGRILDVAEAPPHTQLVAAE